MNYTYEMKEGRWWRKTIDDTEAGYFVKRAKRLYEYDIGTYRPALQKLNDEYKSECVEACRLLAEGDTSALDNLYKKFVEFETKRIQIEIESLKQYDFSTNMTEYLSRTKLDTSMINFLSTTMILIRDVPEIKHRHFYPL